LANDIVGSDGSRSTLLEAWRSQKGLVGRRRLESLMKGKSCCRWTNEPLPIGLNFFFSFFLLAWSQLTEEVVVLVDTE